MADADAGWNDEGLRMRCERMRAALLARGHADQAEVDSYLPGGAANDETDPLGGWIYCYGQLSRLLDRLNPDPGPVRAAEAEAAISAALREEPVVVQLPAPLTNGRSHLAVHPKSLHALLHMAARDQILGRLGIALEYLREQPDGDAATLVRPIMSELSYQQRCQVWAACHPGPGLPFEDDSMYPEPPRWTLEVEVLSVLQVMRAHNVVNGHRLALLRNMLHRRSSGGDAAHLSWATLAVLGARELGVPGGARAVLREHSLERFLAELAVRAESNAEARAEAEASARKG